MSTPDGTPAASTEPPVARGPIFRLLSVALLGFLPGFWAIDRCVGWFDARDKQDADSNYYVRDELLGWVPRPHFEKPEFETVLDRFGLRNPEIPADAPSTEVRVAGFGASLLYGAAGVMQSDIWSARLDREFGGRGVRFLNGGVMGYSSVQACRRAIQLLPELQPDLIFVVVSPGPQSLLDPSASRNWIRSGGRLVRRDVVEGWPAFMHPFLAELHELLLHSNLYVRHRAQIALGNDEREKGLQRWVLSRTEARAAAVPMLDRTFDELAALGAETTARGIELRVLVLPDRAQDSPPRWEAFCRNNSTRGAPPPGTRREEPTEVLLERCGALGLACWDFSAEVERLGADRERLLAEDGGHWSAEGHGVMAEGIARRLRGGLLDELLERRGRNPRR